MSVYLTATAIEDRISYKGEQFFTTATATNFESLLETLEEESRALIESYMGDVTFSEETGKELEVVAPDSIYIELKFPVTSITKVEIKYTANGSYNTMDTERYYYSKHALYLAEHGIAYSDMSRRRWLMRNPISRDLKRVTWRDSCYEVKVTYDRGYSDIPSNVKGIQLSLINNMLRNLRLEQSIGSIEPDAVTSYIEAGKVFTSDIKARLDGITSFGGTTVVV